MSNRVRRGQERNIDIAVPQHLSLTPSHGIGSGSSADAFRANGSHAQKLADSIGGLEKVKKTGPERR